MTKNKQNVRILTLGMQLVACIKTEMSQRMTDVFLISNVKILQAFKISSSKIDLYVIYLLVKQLFLLTSEIHKTLVPCSNNYTTCLTYQENTNTTQFYMNNQKRIHSIHWNLIVHLQIQLHALMIYTTLQFFITPTCFGK